MSIVSKPLIAVLTAALAISTISIFGSASARVSYVSYRNSTTPGTILIRTNQRRLYLFLNHDRALMYPVGVGRRGMQWTGTTIIESKRIRPAWARPPDLKKEMPGIPDVVPGGAPNNPMGVAALVLSGDDYAIHGTNNPSSVGRFSSHGCIRMLNADIIDLYQRTAIGAQVIVEH